MQGQPLEWWLNVSDLSAECAAVRARGLSDDGMNALLNNMAVVVSRLRYRPMTPYERSAMIQDRLNGVAA